MSFTSSDDEDSMSGLRRRRPGVKRQHVRRSAWSHSEDQRLKALMAVHGDKSWQWIANRIGHRSAKQVRQRWYEQIDPLIDHTPLRPDESFVVAVHHETVGSKWADIAALLKHRTANTSAPRPLLISSSSDLPFRLLIFVRALLQCQEPLAFHAVSGGAEITYSAHTDFTVDCREFPELLCKTCAAAEDARVHGS